MIHKIHMLAQEDKSKEYVNSSYYRLQKAFLESTWVKLFEP